MTWKTPRRIAVTLFVISILTDQTALIADTVYLKSGKKIECDSAWEEGKEVRYLVSDGIVGIPKSMVAKIVRAKNASVQAFATTVTADSEGELTAPLNSTAKIIKAQEFKASGKALAEKKDYAGALEQFLKAYELSKDVDTTLNVALAYMAVDDTWNAELYFREVLKKDAKQTVALNYLGDIAWKREDLIEAENFWRRSLEIKNDEAIQKKLARLAKEKKASLAYENSNSRHFLMKYDGGSADPRLVREISDFLEETYQHLSLQFDAFPTAPFVVVLYPRTAFFNSTDAPMWSAGLNDGKIKLPIMGLTSMNEELRAVLVHELSHSFVNYKTSGNCPVWLQEGLAQYSEGRRTSTDTRDALALLAKNNKLPPIQRMSGSFAGASAGAAGVLYAQSLGFTEYLINRYRLYQVNELLNQLAQGEPLDSAFQNTFFVPLSQAQADWQRQLTE